MDSRSDYVNLIGMFLIITVVNFSTSFNTAKKLIWLFGVGRKLNPSGTFGALVADSLVKRLYPCDWLITG